MFSFRSDTHRFKIPEFSNVLYLFEVLVLFSVLWLPMKWRIMKEDKPFIYIFAKKPNGPLLGVFIFNKPSNWIMITILERFW